ncbi:MAG TPA: hypothetical protein VHQ98_06560 [Gaiellaceae bacterium]|nr:hypothetical protein [Gaiellaceae bacterium]
MSVVDEGLLQRRFAELSGPKDDDWQDVLRRTRRRRHRTAALIAAVVVALVVSGFAVGGRVIGLFDEHGKRIPLSSLSERDRESIVNSLCRRLALSHRPGKAPEQVCLDGEPTIEEIANDGSTIHWRITYPWGVSCVASGRVGGYHDPVFGDHIFGSFGCDVGAPEEKLVPTPKRPITVEESIGASRTHPRARLVQLSGLAGQGVASVGLVPKTGSALKVAVHDQAYSFGAIPDRDWVAVAAFDAAGNEVYRESLHLEGVVLTPSSTTTTRVSFPPPPPRPAGAPFQHASSSTATADVYRTGMVVLRFLSTKSEAYQQLLRSSRHSSGGVGITCSTVALGRNRWKDLGGGQSARLAPEIRMRMDNEHGGMPSPPFDFCEITGTYGRYWNDEEGTHELVEVPFTPLAKRYLDERATARDLAYFVRTRKMWRIRKAIHRGEPGPSAAALARLFGDRVVPLARREGEAPAGKIGVWTDRKAIVATETTPGGRRLFVTVQGVLIGPNNVRDLSFTF